MTAPPSGIIKDVEYLDGFQYVGGTLNFFPTAEGYVSVTESNSLANPLLFNYVYNYTDHLGNIRFSYTKDPVSGALTKMGENHYYPFGLKHGVYSGIAMNYQLVDNLPGTESEARPTYVYKTDYQYKYNGKEFQDELGLNMYDMEMRQYDPAIARWVVMDPIIHHNMSPYNAFDNNPVFWADPSGADSRSLIKDLWDKTPEGSNSYWVNEGDGTDDDYKMGADGTITKIKTTGESTDRLYAENGDLIAEGILGGILSDGLNIKKNGLKTKKGANEIGNIMIGQFLRKLSIYEQKEIAWGLYMKGEIELESVINILPYGNSAHDYTDPNPEWIDFGGVTYKILLISNHTHPSFLGGGGTPSRRDIFGGGDLGHAYGVQNYIWNRFGITTFNSSGLIQNKDGGWLQTLGDHSFTKEYVRDVLKWKKEF